MMALNPTMANMPTTASTTPKRKRGMETSITPVIFNFDLSQSTASEDGGNSPRSKVAHKFRGLALGGEDGGGGSQGGGGVGAPGQGDAGDPNDYPASKRARADVVMSEVSHVGKDAGDDYKGDEGDKVIPQPEVVTDAADSQHHNLPLPQGSLQKAYPSVNRLSDSKSRSTKIPGTPPLRKKKLSFAESPKDDSSPEAVEIVDPIRAALTWREDEITIYDPEDEDDDGTGINGVGFKPTPALAHARVMRRRQQLAEYRKREENDARAKRSQRRRGAHRSTPSPEHGQAKRKVRFTDNDKPAIIATN